MSLKLEIKDWEFEITWDGMVCTPVERREKKAETAKKESDRARRRPAIAQEPRLEVAAARRGWSNEVR